MLLINKDAAELCDPISVWRWQICGASKHLVCSLILYYLKDAQKGKWQRLGSVIIKSCFLTHNLKEEMILARLINVSLSQCLVFVLLCTFDVPVSSY